jgi:hypothetical protein
VLLDLRSARIGFEGHAPPVADIHVQNQPRQLQLVWFGVRVGLDGWIVLLHGVGNWLAVVGSGWQWALVWLAWSALVAFGWLWFELVDFGWLGWFAQ